MGHGRRRAALTAALALVAALALLVPAATAFGEHRKPVAGDVGEQLSPTLSPSLSPPEEHDHPPGTFQNSIVEAAHLAAEADGPPPQNPTLPTGFSDVEVIGNITEATSVDFAPNGTAFVALKTGVIKSFDYNSSTGQFEGNATATDFANLTQQVNNYHDRGLAGIAVDPQFPTRPYVYVNYSYNRDPRDNPPVVPKWGPPGQAYDTCPQPADPGNTSIAGCVGMDRVTRLTATQGANGWVMLAGSEKELMASGCYQFGSHASGDVAFGPDGMLYASSGEGASFDTLDYGQYANPCADPTNEGGSLRSQDFRSASDPLGVDGSVFRMNPDTGFTPTQGTANSWLVAYGQRNPWRLTFRRTADGSGLTKELWSGDVGASKAEEVNRIPDVTQVASPINRGWPCYEGNYVASAVQPGWDALNLPLCETLYNQGTGAVEKPYFSYQTRNGGPLVPGEDCANETSSVSGIAFATAFGTGQNNQNNYPAAYKGAMFFADYARSCIWVLGKKADGEPNPAAIQTFVQAAETPVDLLTGPGGDLYYVDYGLNEDYSVGENQAGIHRIVYTGSNAAPTARITADQLSGPAPLPVTFSGTTSTDPDGDALSYAWDLDDDGAFDDGTGATASRTYPLGTHTVSLRVDDNHGHTHATSVQVQAGNTAPTLGTVTPSSSLRWAAGDLVNFSANATDPQQGPMPASAFSWQVSIRHCPSAVCHTHPFTASNGVAAGSFTAPPHEHPSHLLLTVTVTDSGGLTDSRTIQLDPKTVALSFASSPSGATVTVGETDHVAPYSETFIQGAPVTVTAAPTTGTGATIAAFSSWSDGGARSHAVTPPATPATYTATYTRPTAGLTANPTSGTAPLSVTYTASGTNAPGASGLFTYAWDLDNDGQYDDGTGTTQSRTYGSAGSPAVKVLVTDSRGATDAKSVTVTVSAPSNTAPTVTRVTAYPAGGFYVGQILGFDAAATDPQQVLPDSAYSFVMERQDCDSGCPRVVVGRWTGVAYGRFTVPELPYPSHLFLVATVTDAQGATGRSELRIEPQPVALTVKATRKLRVDVDGARHKSGWSGRVVMGATVRLAAPRSQTRNGVRWVFVRWSDGGARKHDLTVWGQTLTVKAVYRRVR